jgi:hypothetical protein
MDMVSDRAPDGDRGQALWREQGFLKKKSNWTDHIRAGHRLESSRGCQKLKPITGRCDANDIKD